MKKIIIPTIFTLTIFSAGALFAQNISFPDVKSTDWFHQYVTAIADWDVVSGNDDGTFAPGRNINRAEFAKMLVQYDKRVDEKIAAIEASSAANSAPVSKPLPSIMYIRRTKGSTPAACPTGWNDEGLGADTSDSLERICTTSQQCQVAYIDRTSSAPAQACPTGWKEADFANVFSGGANIVRRTCYVCQ